jgi:general secretion pathway protein G
MKRIVLNFKIPFFNSKGFTLVELLIVVAIIGILSALLTANYIAVRERARDSQRKADLKQIQSALELYRADQGSYPTTLANCGTSLKSPDCQTSTYMRTVPQDPQGGAYTYTSNGVTYTITACLENANDPQKDTTNVAPCNGTTSFSTTVANP